MIALAIDPGAHAGVAIVTSPWGDDPRPRLWYATGISVSRPSKLRGLEAQAEWERRFFNRARVCLLEAAARVARRKMSEVLVGIEWRDCHQLAGEKAEEVYALGARRAALSAAVADIFDRPPALLPHQWWVETINANSEVPIPRGKQGTRQTLGEHRIAEAAVRLADARELLMALPKSVRVDTAEAALMAAALIYDHHNPE